jgi:hypothetical protein
MTKRQEMSRSLTIVMLASILATTGAFAQQPDDLATIRAGVPKRSPQGQAARFVDIDQALLEGESPSLRVELPDGPVEVLELDDFERRGKGNITWRGKVRYEPLSRAVLTLKNGVVSGTIHSQLGTYEIRSAPGGGQVIEKLDPSRFAECAPGRQVPNTNDSPEASWDSFEASMAASDTADEITVMVLYTPEARDGAGGTAQIEVLIQSAVDVSNTAFADSGMAARFTLVFAGEASYSDSADMDADLGWLQSNAGVTALRDQYGADMVSMIVNTGAYCGTGYVMRDPGPAFADWAFQVTHRTCAVGNLSFAHEHGHNLGFEHDPANGPRPGSASYDWSFAHYVNGSYRTVMAYSSECTLGCTRVARFSNPSLTYSGQSTGLSDERDNSQTGDATATIAANFRSTATCGNGVIEGAEECDGSDVGDATCGAVGCSSGSPTCSSSCTLDYSACQSCGTCDFDGICESGENCGNCASDCSSGSGATCGNGVCEAADGENCETCAQDCNGKVGGKPSQRFCCGDGGGPNPVGAEDSRCTTGGFQCTDIAATGSCCGDGSCTGFEDGSSCSLDCGAAPSCGDDVCDPGETACSCDVDCGPSPTSEWLTCGDGVDNDCDGVSDCADGDCSDDALCGLSCESAGATCSGNSDCCSGSCKGPRGRKTCK